MKLRPILRKFMNRLASISCNEHSVKNCNLQLDLSNNYNSQTVCEKPVNEMPNTFAKTV